MWAREVKGVPRDLYHPASLQTQMKDEDETFVQEMQVLSFGAQKREILLPLIHR